MDALPFTVAYGVWIARSFFVVGALLGIAFAVLLARRRRARGAALLTSGMPAPARSLDELEHGERACVEGILRAEPEIAAFDGRPAALSTLGGLEPRAAWIGARPARLFVETEGGRVELEGPVRVLRGTSERDLEHPGRALRERAAALADAETLEAALEARALATVASGARVRAYGVAARRAADDAEYRRPGARWTLRGDERAELRVAAVRPPRLVRPAVGALARSLFFGGVGTYVLAAFAGALLETAVPDPAPPGEPRDEVSGVRVALALTAAALPFGRRGSYRAALAEMWPSTGPASRQRADTSVALAATVGCESEVRALVRFERLEEAIERAEACGDARALAAAAGAAYALGDFPRASALFARAGASAPANGSEPLVHWLAFAHDDALSSLRRTRPAAESRCLGWLLANEVPPSYEGAWCEVLLAARWRSELEPRPAFVRALGARDVPREVRERTARRLGRVETVRFADLVAGEREERLGSTIALLTIEAELAQPEATEAAPDEALPDLPLVAWDAHAIGGFCPIAPDRVPGLEARVLERMRALPSPTPRQLWFRAHLEAGAATVDAWIEPRVALEAARRARADFERLAAWAREHGAARLSERIERERLRASQLEGLLAADLRGALTMPARDPRRRTGWASEGDWLEHVWRERWPVGYAYAARLGRLPAEKRARAVAWIEHGDALLCTDCPRSRMFCQAALRARAAREAGLEERAARWERAARAHRTALLRSDDALRLAAIEPGPPSP